MVEIIPARPEMALMIDAQPRQQVRATVEYLTRLLAAGPGFAAVSGTTILGIGGLQEVWRDRAVAWALLSRSIGPAMTPVTRSALRWFAVAPWQRIEAYVDPTHEAAERWAALLGFEREGTMRRFHEGRDFDLYARVR